MNKKNNIILEAMLAMVIMTSSAASIAQAGESKDEKLQLFSQAKISLIEAINAAEQKTGGKALEAELDDKSNNVQFEIEILKDGKIHEVIVDGKTGKVLKVSLDDESSESTEDEEE